MKIVITGATGFIGRHLLTRLTLEGHECLVLAKNPLSAKTYSAQALKWDAETDELSEHALGSIAGADALIHLAGVPIAEKRWNEVVKKQIYNSRVNGTRALVNGIQKLSPEKRPKFFLSGSAIGIYGDRGDEDLDEASASGTSFLSKIVCDWEGEAFKAKNFGVRVVQMRTGIVLGNDGGALEKMKPTVLGTGKQWMSWIHLEDVLRFIECALNEEKFNGVYNLTAPNPVRNEEFTRKYAQATKAPAVIKVPQFILKPILGEMSCVVLDSMKVYPQRLLQEGFSFTYPTLEDAFKQLFPNPLERKLSVVQFVPKPIEEVFSFFSRAENLEQITPPWLNFHIDKTSTPQITNETLIDYKLKIHGLPVRWQSRIESWEPGSKFVDTQTKGPYAKWHHTHRFKSVPGGTLVLDDVIYKLPGGFLGDLFGLSLVKKDIAEIFAYRRKTIAKIFSNSNSQEVSNDKHVCS